MQRLRASFGGTAVSYPRPLLRRERWTTLDGPWEFAFHHGTWERPDEVEFDRKILVPFAPETTKSGIAADRPFNGCWYRRRFDAGTLTEDELLILHFGAVDYEATVWVNGRIVARHEGGYTPFSADVTDALETAGTGELVVFARDDAQDLAKPRGKQDWLPEPHSIWYPRTTGIWQTVWFEKIARTHIASLRWTTNLERWDVGLELRVCEANQGRHHIRVRLEASGNLLADDLYLVSSGEVHRRISLSDPGIDDSRNELLWSPESPNLIEAELELLDEQDRVLDRVVSYTALRSFVAQGHRLLLNGRPYPLRLVLDQGYWPETGMTPPDDAAVRRDVELTKQIGFNGARKHQKIEDPRYLYWADRLGLLVFEEMPSAYRFTRTSVDRTVREWLEVLRRDLSHPCIIAWVPFNESWGVPNLPDSAAEQNYVRALYHLTKTIDPTRLVLGNDGWESVATDIIGIHDYDDSPSRIAERYGSFDAVPRLLSRERPGGRALVIGMAPTNEHPILLSEFGGIALSREPSAWGYSASETADELEQAYTALLAVVNQVEIFSGFCYTQLTDTYQEANGLLYADRRPKFPLERMFAATIGREHLPGARTMRSEVP